jgi:hypothetical protein
MFDHYLAVIGRANKFPGSNMESETWKFGFQGPIVLYRPDPDELRTDVLEVIEPRTHSFGLVAPYVAETFKASKHMSDYFVFDNEAKLMLLRREYHAPADFQIAMAEIHADARNLLYGKPFGHLDSLPRNNYPLLDGPSPKYSVPRNIAGLLGIVTSGIHVNVYSKTKTGDVFVMVRTTKLPGTDNKMEPCFGGAVLDTDESPHDALVRMVRAETGSRKTADAMKDAQASWKITYRDIQPVSPDVKIDRPEFGCRHVFDLEVAAKWRPKFKYRDVPGQTIELLSVHEVKTALKEGDFPGAAGLAMLDFLLRHRLLGLSEEKTAVLEEQLRPSLAMTKHLAGMKTVQRDGK